MSDSMRVGYDKGREGRERSEIVRMYLTAGCAQVVESVRVKFEAAVVQGRL